MEHDVLFLAWSLRRASNVLANLLPTCRQNGLTIQAQTGHNFSTVGSIIFPAMDGESWQLFDGCCGGKRWVYWKFIVQACLHGNSQQWHPLRALDVRCIHLRCQWFVHPCAPMQTNHWTHIEILPHNHKDIHHTLLVSIDDTRTMSALNPFGLTFLSCPMCGRQAGGWIL